MTILENIIKHKKEVIEKRKRSVSFNILERSGHFSRKTYSLKKKLISGGTGIIAEFKRRSPSKGMINEKVQAGEVAEGYINAGATAVSVLTDEKFFGGSNEDLIEVRNRVKAPVLRKDFIIDDFQIIEAKSIGADIILLIAAVLTKEEVEEFTNLAHSLGLEVLVELHSANELDKIAQDVDIIGVNNRNLNNFLVDINTSLDIAKLLPSGIMKVSESGIHEVDSIGKLMNAGYNGFLMGENFMKCIDPVKACDQFIESIKTKKLIPDED